MAENKVLWLIFLCMFIPVFLSAIQAPKNIYTTQHIVSDPPHIDGYLNDACWEEGTWFTDFQQYYPDEGEAPSQKTAMKVLYDDDALYVAFRSYDNEPDKIDLRAGRRDDFSGDVVGVCFDSYYDHRAGFEFDVSASGIKVDLILENGNHSDAAWDAVWDAKTALEDSAWTAEFRIPFSQLRYADREEQVWGMHAWRWINRLQEESQFSLIPRDGPGHLFDMGEIHGIRNITQKRRVEIMPYTMGKLITQNKDEDNPFSKDSEWGGDIGFDGKIGLSSDFTMDFTVNPDFGQVESDPSQLNLTVYETFYNEKRPFFLEGKNIFDFTKLFYSRRIGQAPSYDPDLNDNEYAKSADATSILGAVKISGKTRKGLSIGVIESVTGKETVEVSKPFSRYTETAEPVTNYFVGRVQQDIDSGNAAIGGFVTAVNRDIHEDHLNFLPKEAYAASLDYEQYLMDRAYQFEVNLFGSSVSGHRDAILDLQESSLRYYQRPDADDVSIDSSRTKLQGHGGSIEFDKVSGGCWRFHTSLGWRSPGLETNDMGYLTLADHMEAGGHVGYVVNKPKRLSYWSLFAGNWWQSNYAGDLEYTERFLEGFVRFKNNLAIYTSVYRRDDGWDPRLLRGGPSIYTQGLYCINVNLQSDDAKQVYGNVNFHVHAPDDHESTIQGVHPRVWWKISDRVMSSARLDLAREKEWLHYIETCDWNNDKRYILGSLDRKTLGVQLRFDVSITPDLSIQYYGNPYLSVGKYSDLKRIDQAHSRSYDDLYQKIDDSEITYNDDDWVMDIDENRDGETDYSFDNPDFNYREFRSNLVIRWEFKPGSTFYLVWTHGRSDYEGVSDHSLKNNWSTLWDLESKNVFLAKMSYWFSL